MNARVVLVGAASRGLLFGVTAATLSGYEAHVESAYGLWPPSVPPPLLSVDVLAAAIELGAPVGAAAAASAAVELAWPGRGEPRRDLVAGTLAFVVGPAAAALAALQVGYARGVLLGGNQVLDYAAVRPASVAHLLPGIALLSLALAVGGVVRRCGGSWSDGFLGVCVIGYPVLFAARLVELSQTPPYRVSSTAIEAALVGLPLLTLAVSLLCAAADALVVKFVGAPTTDGAPA